MIKEGEPKIGFRFQLRGEVESRLLSTRQKSLNSKKHHHRVNEKRERER